MKNSNLTAKFFKRIAHDSQFIRIFIKISPFLIAMIVNLINEHVKVLFHFARLKMLTVTLATIVPEFASVDFMYIYKFTILLVNLRKAVSYCYKLFILGLLRMATTFTKLSV